MDKNKQFDTSEIMSENDYKTLNEIKKITRTIFSHIDKDLLIEKIRDIVDTCELVNFKNDRSRKFIDNKRPVLYLTIDKQKLIDKNELPNFTSDNQEASFYSNIVYENVVKYINEFVNDCIRDNENIQSFLNGRNLFNDLETSELLAHNSIFSSIFGIRLENANKHNVTVEVMF